MWVDVGRCEQAWSEGVQFLRFLYVISRTARDKTLSADGLNVCMPINN